MLEYQSPYIFHNYGRSFIRPVRGEGSWLYDEDGTKYLDFASGIAVNCLGHAHPKLAAALKKQADTLWHTSNLFQSPYQEKFAELLVKNSCADKAMMVNSGGEALEAAFKLARRYQYIKEQPHRYRVITVEGAFHGRTFSEIAAADNAKMLEGFGPKMDGFDCIEFDNIEALKNAVCDETAAICFEPIQGEGGIRALSDEFVKTARKLADEHGLVLIFDEVQTGAGRTGKLFAYEHYGIEPDVITIAKGFGGGFPLGALLAKDEFARAFTPSTHGTTFGGNPLAMSVGVAVMEELLQDDLLASVAKKGEKLQHDLQALANEFPDLVAGARGKGLLVGLEVKICPRDIVAAFHKQQLITVPASNNVVRFLPSLIVSDKELEIGIDKVRKSLSDLMATMNDKK